MVLKAYIRTVPSTVPCTNNCSNCTMASCTSGPTTVPCTNKCSNCTKNSCKTYCHPVPALQPSLCWSVCWYLKHGSSCTNHCFSGSMTLQSLLLGNWVLSSCHSLPVSLRFIRSYKKEVAELYVTLLNIFQLYLGNCNVHIEQWIWWWELWNKEWTWRYETFSLEHS